ncbi:MAG: hypothetical protein R3F17_11825 [Planctomycetota bacterium]
MSTTEISTLQTPSGDPGHSFGRTLAWIGLSLVCLVLRAAFGVWGLGESMLGPSVTRSPFRALNDRIVGLLEHDSSRLRWNEPSRIEGLRLKSGDGTTLAAGDLEVPALSTPHGTATTCCRRKASRCNSANCTWVSTRRARYSCSRSWPCAARAAGAACCSGNWVAPWSTGGTSIGWSWPMNAATVVQGELRDTDWVSWMPRELAHFELDGTFADSGEVHGQFDWQGMGEGLPWAAWSAN